MSAKRSESIMPSSSAMESVFPDAGLHFLGCLILQNGSNHPPSFPPPLFTVGRLKILQGFVMHMTLMMLLFYHRLDQLGTIAMSVDREHWIH